MLIHASEVRSKNFHFFLVASGFIILAITNVSEPMLIRLVAVVGTILSTIFILLDIRTLQLIKDARHDLEKIEPKFGITIHTVDQLADPTRGKLGTGRARLISHTFGYRVIFSMMALLFIVWGCLKV
jgi:hypothetical protein